MDSFVLLALAAFAIIGFIVGCARRGARLWIRLTAAPGVVWLAFYFLVELVRTQPALIQEDPQAGYPTLAFMCLGVIALLSKPVPPEDKHDDHGGALSA